MLFSASCCATSSPSLSCFISSGERGCRSTLRKLALNSDVSSRRFRRHRRLLVLTHSFIWITGQASVFVRHGRVPPSGPSLSVLVYPARNARLPLISAAATAASNPAFFSFLSPPPTPSKLAHSLYTLHCIIKQPPPNPTPCLPRLTL